ncbi:MAG: hypothetical protein IJQ75_03905 [Synergistaceae bacterium]|nr:hypothetical protein [Synergistaceae bacterium]
MAMLCGTDAEVAERLIRSADFTCTEHIDALEMTADDFPDRSGDSNHVLGMLRNDDEATITGRIWTAQVRVFFLMIELTRVRIIRSDSSLSGSIQFALRNIYLSCGHSGI